MCTNCKASGKCDCAGGLGLDSCQCEEGDTCPICKHEAATNGVFEFPLLIDVPIMKMSAREVEVKSGALRPTRRVSDSTPPPWKR